MNGWVPLEEYRLRWGCDAYYLNVELQGRQDFKIAGADWAERTIIGARQGGVGLDAARATDPGGVNNLLYRFDGEQTVRLGFPEGRPVLTIGPRSFRDAAEPRVTDPVALALRHDSRDPADKSPFGAVREGADVDFALNAPTGVTRAALVVALRRLEGNQEVLEYKEVARIPLTRASGPAGARWRGRYRFSGIGVYGYHFEVEIAGRTYIYGNNRAPIYWTRERGANGVGAVELPPASPEAIRRFRLTVYARDFTVPAWAKDAIYYYIFPDRFRNGDPSNDPRPGPNTFHDKSLEVHKTWLEKPWRPNSGDGSDDLGGNDFFGGDIAGVIEKLDYIADLGANVIYSTPLFQASSNHKYDAADYHHIDDRFGTNADFERLAREGARRGVRILPDASLNHTGRDSVYFDRYAKFPGLGALEGGEVKPASPYASWYQLNPAGRTPEERYKGWSGAMDLPELNEMAPAFKRFAFEAPDSVTKVWLDRGAAGWRMDVVPWVPDAFWREWRRAVKAHRPDALTVSETWFDSSKYLLGDEFDSTMNYIFRNAVLDFVAGGDAAANYRNLEYLREVYPEPAFFALMNLLSTHDTARSLHVLGYEGEGDAAKAADAKRRFRLAVFFQMIFPGAPAIYYGDEVGVTGGDDPYNRGTYPWTDQGGRPDMALHHEVRALAHMRRDNAVLRRGELLPPLYADKNVIVLGRRDGAVVAITALNNADSPRTVEVALPASFSGRVFVDPLGGRAVRAEGRSLRLTLPALEGLVLISR
jgi:glycosidase